MEVRRILLAEDDSDFGGILKQYLEMTGYQVDWAKDGVEALELFKKDAFDICVLDVMMPRLDGFALAEKIIELNPEAPFVFLTARKMKEDKIRGLKLGADDYIAKPFEADELVLRINNILKRSAKKTVTKPEKQIFKIGSFLFDTWRSELRKDDHVQHLTGKEADLIRYLFENRNRLLKREEVLLAIWKNDDFFSGRSMDVFISKLRKYFRKDACISIESVRGIGLEFKVPEMG